MLALTSQAAPPLAPSCHRKFSPSLSKRSSRWCSPRRAVEREESQFEVDKEKARQALRKLDEQLQSLSQQESLPRKKTPYPYPDPSLDRDLITGMREETPEFSGSYLAYFGVAMVILTIFNNIVFSVFIKPSVDGNDQASRLERVPLSEPTE